VRSPRFSRHLCIYLCRQIHVGPKPKLARPCVDDAHGQPRCQECTSSDLHAVYRLQVARNVIISYATVSSRFLFLFRFCLGYDLLADVQFICWTRV
jgi:hypothetical protein